MRAFYFFALLLIGLASSDMLSAQRFSAMLNVEAFDINRAESDSQSVNLTDYDGSVSFSGNLRLFTQRNWAYRFGLGWQNIEYRIDDGLTTNYEAERNNFTFTLGLERHFDLGLVTIYPGIYVPITYVGEDKILESNLQLTESIRNGDFHAGLGFITGINVQLLKIIRTGVEFNLGYQQFKQDVVEPFQDDREIKIRNIGFSTQFVIGIAL